VREPGSDRARLPLTLKAMVRDVSQADFQSAVLDRSAEVPVVVDFWAEWCGPCRQLGPALEAEAGRREGEVELAKVDVDANGALAQSFGVQGIPAVKAFKDGQVAAEFTGAIPPAKVREFFDSLVPSEADRLASSDVEADLRRALEIDPRQPEALPKLARILLARGGSEEAAELLGRLPDDFAAAGLLARIELTDDASERLAGAFDAWDENRYEDALEALQAEVAEAPEERRDPLRRVMVAIFTELGVESELAREHRRRLALALT
jgi:putative thioredoxin